MAVPGMAAVKMGLIKTADSLPGPSQLRVHSTLHGLEDCIVARKKGSLCNAEFF